MTFEELAVKSTSESVANFSRMDRFTYRWGFVFRMRPKKNVAAEPVHNPHDAALFYDKSFIQNLKLSTPFAKELA